jgi:hypothetical protein
VIKPENDSKCTHEDLPRLWAERKSTALDTESVMTSVGGASGAGVCFRKHAERVDGTAEQVNGTAERANEASTSGSQETDEILILPENTVREDRCRPSLMDRTF